MKIFSNLLGKVSYESDSGHMYEAEVYVEQIKPTKYALYVEGIGDTTELPNDHIYDILLEKASDKFGYTEDEYNAGWFNDDLEIDGDDF